ncbi:MAG: MmcB family DNA repair protein [Alphaproteobacteria bacterium]|jgi:hypothetical protein|nr:MmcB family DNA repair protein [Alphaproteobacteria bacterium]
MQHDLPFGESRRRAKRPPASVRRDIPGSRPDLAGRGPVSTGRATAEDITRGAARLLNDLGYRSLTELRLANGRRVDLIGLDGRGRFAIVEVKSGLPDLRADDKWPDYLDACDRFFFAVGTDFPLAKLPEETGIIVADRFGGEVVRPAPLSPMATAARNRQTLLFAHAAAGRLSRLDESGL